MFRLFKSLLLVLFLFPLCTIAQSDEKKSAFISDALFVYLHAGPGTQFRIVGTLNAGQSITVLTEDKDAGYSQIQYDNGKTAWIPKQYVSLTPGLASQLEELQKSHEQQSSRADDLQQERDELKQQLTEVTTERQRATDQLEYTNRAYEQLKAQMDSMQASVWQNPMVLGSIILFGGLLLGLILPLLWPKRRSSERWM